MADEFVYFLVGGLAIMAALFVIFGFGSFTGTSAGEFSFVTSPIFVGTADFDTVETIYAHFDASNFIQTNVFDLGSRRVSNGLLFGDLPVKVDLGRSDFTTLSFDVTGTNGYGDLIVKLDGNIVEKRPLIEGHYELMLPAGSLVEIQAQSSEWRVWAPAVYDLQNVKITANFYPRDSSTYTFEVDNPEEIQSIRVDFYMDSNAGRLLMKMNGDIVYDGAVNNLQSVYLDESKLDDVNILTFDAREDSDFSGRATIALTRRSVQEKTLAFDINMTDDEYNRFNGGTISFDVTDIMHPGGYSISIVNNGEVLLQEYAKLERGYFVLNVAKRDLKPGLNEFVITPADGATFLVQSLTTRL